MQNQIVALQQFDGTVKLLKLNLATGAREIIPAEGVEKGRIARGMYEDEGEGAELETVAMVATPEGPLLMLQHQPYRPSVEDTKIVVQDDVQLCHFIVFDQDQPIFRLSYEPKSGIGLHPYVNEREDIDFYYWLSKNINDPKLHQTYMQPTTFFETGPTQPELS